MPFYEAAAPVAVVIAAFVLLREFVGPKVVWARWLILAFTLAVVVRYLPWRFTETVMSRDILSLDGAWIWFLFAVECVFIADLLKILLVRCRFADRTAEADVRQRELERRPIAEWPSVDVFIPTYNEPLELLLYL